MLVIDSAGRDVLRYAKMHTCDFSNEKYFAPGEAPEVVGLSVRGEIVRIGSMICYDREFPETSKILMFRGAEIALVPNACPIERHRKGQLAARAFENMMGVVMANYATPEQNGNSAAYSGICFDDDLNALDDIVMEAGGEEATCSGFRYAEAETIPRKGRLGGCLSQTRSVRIAPIPRNARRV